VSPIRTRGLAEFILLHRELLNSSRTPDRRASLRSASIFRIRGRNLESMLSVSTTRQIRGHFASVALVSIVSRRSRARRPISLRRLSLNSLALYCRMRTRTRSSDTFSAAPTRQSSLKINPGYTPGAWRFTSVQKLARVRSPCLIGRTRGPSVSRKLGSECHAARTRFARLRRFSTAGPAPGGPSRILATSPRSTPVTRAIRETLGRLRRPASAFAAW